MNYPSGTQVDFPEDIARGTQGRLDTTHVLLRMHRFDRHPSVGCAPIISPQEGGERKKGTERKVGMRKHRETKPDPKSTEILRSGIKSHVKLGL